MEEDIHMHININNSKGNEFRMTKEGMHVKTSSGLLYNFRGYDLF